jgi:hypothetical protein
VRDRSSVGDERRTPVSTPVFELSELTTGAHAHGFGHVGDGREFAFRVRSNLAVVEIYKADAAEAFPLPEDVEATAQRPVTDVDLTDERGLLAVGWRPPSAPSSAASAR